MLLKTREVSSEGRFTNADFGYPCCAKVIFIQKEGQLFGKCVNDPYKQIFSS